MARRGGFSLVLLSLSMLIVAGFPEIPHVDAQILSRVAALAFDPSPETNLASSVTDPAAGFAYFGTYTAIGVIVKVRLSDFTQVGSATLNSFNQNALIDGAGSYAYFRSGTTVVKVRLSDLVQVGTLSLNDVYGSLTASVIDSRAGYAYFGGGGAVAKVRLSDFIPLGNLVLNSGVYTLSTSVIDPVAGFAYFGSYTSPGVVVKLDVAAPPGFDFSLSNSGKISVLQGGSGSTTVSLAVSNGTPQTESLFCVASTLPAGASSSFTPSSVSANGSSVVTVSTPSATPIGSFQVQVASNPMGITTVPAVFTLTVNPTILGLDPIIFYSLIGGAIVLAIIGVTVVRRRHGSIPSTIGSNPKAS